MAEETVSTSEEAEEVSADDLADQLGESEEGATAEADAPVKEGATPEEEGDAEFEYDPGDGSGVQRLTAEQLAQRLSNYQKLQAKVGSQANEIGEYNRRIKELEEAKQRQVDNEEVATNGWDEADFEDPDVVRKALVEVLSQNKKLQAQVAGIPSLVETVAEQKAGERAAIAEYNRVVAGHPKLNRYDQGAKESIVQAAINFGNARNKTAGRTIYPNLSSAVDGFLATISGEAKPLTQAAFLKSLKKPGGEVASASGTKSSSDVVKRYKDLSTSEARAKFLATLTDEEEKLINAAIYAGEV